MKLKTIIFGASGMVGEGVLLTALDNQYVESVLVVGRRTCGIKHKKLKEIIHNDFYNISPIEDKLKGYNACFFCLGTSSVGMKKEEYKRVTYDLTLHCAEVLSKLNPDMTFCYVSGTGTDSTEKGKIMWARVKGKTENDLMKLPFKDVFNFRPGFMKPVDGQKNIKKMFRVFTSVYPTAKMLFPGSGCKLEDLGKAMLKVSLTGYPNQILGNNDIEKAASLL